MMELVEFLRARLEAEEQLARTVAERYVMKTYDQPYWPLPSVKACFERHDDPAIRAGLDLIRLYGPARVLREVEAKRRIIDRHELESWHSHVLGADVVSCQACSTPGDEWPCPDLRLLALPYADHPDYRDEWKP